jgi:hypothetical protein
VQLFLYRRVKYKDDGRELVSLIEFITIHVTFPILNAWISYMLAYQIMITLAQSCPWTGNPLQTQPFRFCAGDQNLGRSEYYYSLFFEPAKVLYLVLVAETLINLAYYKDVVFGAAVAVEFAGILNNSINLRIKTRQDLQA